MNRQSFFKIRIYFIGAAALAIWSLLIWNYFHGGIPRHNILAREDLPSFSNAWGALLIPLLTWFLLYRIQRRLDKNPTPVVPSTILYGFAGALVFGITLSILVMSRVEHVPGYMMLSVFLMALFIPIYRAEFLLGFVLGMTYAFGAVLPIGMGSILISIGAIIHLLIRPAILFLFAKLVRSSGNPF
jgi:hypothetical protein